MGQERILILGTTGVAKQAALSQLSKYVESQAIKLEYEVIDFESQFLKPVLYENDKDLFSYLDDANLRQRELWLKAWDRLKPVLRANTEKHILLCLHGVLTRENTGNRSPINILSVKDFAPTKIITLVDDVHIKWHRTQLRSGGERRRGQPTLEQLVDARRAEIFIGDLIAGHQEIRPRHHVLSVHHPARTLYRLLFGGRDIRTVYLSFPISGPRKLLSEGDENGISEVNEFLKAVNMFEVRNPKVACFCPLTIDEYPLINCCSARDSAEEGETVSFSMANERWDVKSFWKDEILLCDECLPDVNIPRKQIVEAAGMIKSDVKLRDYRLVTQSKYVLAFNPWFCDEESQGVRNEISVAILRGTPVYIYQDKQHDSGDIAKSLFKEGSLGHDPKVGDLCFFDSIEKALQQLLV